jgi:hypothetical protein
MLTDEGDPVWPGGTYQREQVLAVADADSFEGVEID